MLNHLELNKNIIMQLGTRIILNFLLLRSFVPKPFSSTGLSRSRTKNWTLTAMTALESGARRSRRNQRGLENVPGAFAAFPTGVNNLAPTSSGYIILWYSEWGYRTPPIRNPLKIERSFRVIYYNFSPILLYLFGCVWTWGIDSQSVAIREMMTIDWNWSCPMLRQNHMNFGGYANCLLSGIT